MRIPIPMKSKAKSSKLNAKYELRNTNSNSKQSKQMNDKMFLTLIIMFYVMYGNPHSGNPTINF